MNFPISAFISTVAGILVIPCVHAAPYTWDASGAAPPDDGGGSWNATGGTNWFSGTSYGAWGNTFSDVATFGVANGAAGTISVGTVNANGITFNAAGSGNYVLSGGTITLGGTTPTINAAVNANISSVLAGSAGMTKSGAGTLVLTATNTYTGGTIINNGTVELNSSSSTDASIRGTVTVNAGGILSVGGSQAFSGFGRLNNPSGGRISTLNITGGIVTNTIANAAIVDATVNMTGGILSSTNTTNTINWRNTTLNSLASATASLVSAKLTIRNDFATGVPLTIDVADGAAVQDLRISESILQAIPGGSVVKNGAGTLVLSASNSYTGNTTVNTGSLLVNGNISTSILTTVKNTATLGGTGTVGAVNVEAGGIIAPGTSAGNLSISNGLTLAGLYSWELGALSTASPGVNFDRLTLTSGNADITGAALSLGLGSFAPTAIPFWQIDQSWAGILNNTGAGSLTGSFAAIDNTLWSSLGSFSTTSTGNDVNLVWTAVPEPSTIAIPGLLGVCLLFRRARSRQTLV